MKLHTALAAMALSLALLTACGPKEAPQEPAVSAPDASSSVTTPDVSAPDSSAQPEDTVIPDSSAQPEETVTPAPEAAPALTLNQFDFTLFSVGEAYHVQAQLSGSDEEVVWTSSDEAIATVSEDGMVTAVAPGNATITATAGELSAKCIVRCKFESETPAVKPEEKPSASGVDLAAFFADISGQYEMGPLELADKELLDNFYPGMSAIDTEQCLVYVCMMTMNNGEFGLVQVKDAKDVDAVKAVFQARVDDMSDRGAWYPAAIESWAQNSRIVSNGNYVMMVVNENHEAIINAFNALFK